MANNTFVCSWSGGKDSCFATMQAIAAGYTPTVLLNVLNEAGKISRSHGIPSSILELQAKAMDLPICMISSSWKDYEQNFVAALRGLKEKHQLSHAVFGDIDLQAHRDWEEMVCEKAQLTALLPLWQLNRKELVLNMLTHGIETIIVSCNTTLGETFLGKTLTPALIENIESLGVDPCGETGEFHTLVVNCPMFKDRIDVQVMNIVLHEDYWFAELG